MTTFVNSKWLQPILWSQDLSDIDPALVQVYLSDDLGWLRAICRLTTLSRVRALPKCLLVCKSPRKPNIQFGFCQAIPALQEIQQMVLQLGHWIASKLNQNCQAVFILFSDIVCVAGPACHLPGIGTQLWCRDCSHTATQWLHIRGYVRLLLDIEQSIVG